MLTLLRGLTYVVGTERRTWCVYLLCSWYMIGCKLEGLWNQVSHSWTELQAEETLLPGRPTEYKVLLNISWICFKDQRKKNGTEKIQSAGIQVRQVTLSSTCTFPAVQEVHSVLRCLKILNITAVMELGAECEDNRCVTKDWLYPVKRGCVRPACLSKSCQVNNSCS